MKRLLLLLVPLALADPAIAFDGGWYDKKEKPKLSTDQSETLGKYSEFHQSCIDIQMTMWGEVAELMEDLSTAHCYCEYTKLEDLESITWADQNAADIECANQGTISKKSFHLVGSSTTPSTLRRRAGIVPNSFSSIANA